MMSFNIFFSMLAISYVIAGYNILKVAILYQRFNIFFRILAISYVIAGYNILKVAILYAQLQYIFQHASYPL